MDPTPRRRAAVGLAAAGALCAILAVLGWFTVAPRLASGEPGGSRSTGWLVTVYYTAVESFHHGEPTPVTGCPSTDCAHGTDDLGTYPGSFVRAVHDEGTGRITSGPHAGDYLNWSVGVGYWLDTAPRDGYGRPLLPFRSAASDTLREGTAVRLADCGDTREHVPENTCRSLRAGHWQIRDQFSPGLGGPKHIDLYIGEENTEGFTHSPVYVTLHDATLLLGRA